MRVILAILVCKLGRFFGRLVGRGSSLPGKWALRVCPDVLARVRLPQRVIAVTGSNGKTSTVEMIAAIFRAAKLRVVYNEEGSNQIEGVATLILSHCSIFGRVRADVLLMESDERYAVHTFRFFHPTHFVVTNLYRDQLTRNGHPEWVFDALRPALPPEGELILNADDPLSACFGVGRGNVTWYGLAKCDTDADRPTGVYHDGAHCPLCGQPMRYDYVHYNHIGAYHCTACGFRKPRTDITGMALDLWEGFFSIDNRVRVELAFRSIYNVYNILAAYAVTTRCGVDPEIAAESLSRYVLKNGRMKTFRLGEHHGILLTSKHENSIAYDTNLRYIADCGKDCSVLLIVDAVSRKYFTSETSWLWDIDFNQLNQPHVQRVILSGQYCNDLAERFSYSSLPTGKWQVVEKISDAAELLKGSGSEALFLVTCFSDRDKFLSLTDPDAG